VIAKYERKTNMTLTEIMTSQTLSDAGKRMEIELIDGSGGKYVVRYEDDPDWRTNGRHFRSLKTARAYASMIPGCDVVGPDATCYEPEFVAEAV
jgi:hypothetical protein